MTVARLFMTGLLMALASVWSGAVWSEAQSEALAREDLRFQPLNPARGDASPRAGVLWGDIRSDVPSGAIIEFADGFVSPPHIHNVSYRGVVISGAVHNDDPSAERLWLGPGSFWVQPAGEPHITAAAPGSKATIFLEILEGPYRVQPGTEAFDNGERPLNLDASNLVWLDASDLSWIEVDNSSALDGPAIAFLWGVPQGPNRYGTLLRLPGGFRGELQGSGAWLRTVLIRGAAEFGYAEKSRVANFGPGSYVGTKGGAQQTIACQPIDGCLLYVSTLGKFRLVQE